MIHVVVVAAAAAVCPAHCRCGALVQTNDVGAGGGDGRGDCDRPWRTKERVAGLRPLCCGRDERVDGRVYGLLGDGRVGQARI